MAEAKYTATEGRFVTVARTLPTPSLSGGVEASLVIDDSFSALRIMQAVRKILVALTAAQLATSAASGLALSAFEDGSYFDDGSSFADR